MSKMELTRRFMYRFVPMNPKTVWSTPDTGDNGKTVPHPLPVYQNGQVSSTVVIVLQSALEQLMCDKSNTT